MIAADSALEQKRAIATLLFKLHASRLDAADWVCDSGDWRAISRQKYLAWAERLIFEVRLDCHPGYVHAVLQAAEKTRHDPKA